MALTNLPTEMLEQVLSHVDMKTLLLSQRVNSTFRDVIKGSPTLRKNLWLAPSNEMHTTKPECTYHTECPADGIGCRFPDDQVTINPLIMHVLDMGNTKHSLPMELVLPYQKPRYLLEARVEDQVGQAEVTRFEEARQRELDFMFDPSARLSARDDEWLYASAEILEPHIFDPHVGLLGLIDELLDAPVEDLEPNILDLSVQSLRLDEECFYPLPVGCLEPHISEWKRMQGELMERKTEYEQCKLLNTVPLRKLDITMSTVKHCLAAMDDETRHSWKDMFVLQGVSVKELTISYKVIEYFKESMSERGRFPREHAISGGKMMSGGSVTMSELIEVLGDLHRDENMLE